MCNNFQGLYNQLGSNPEHWSLGQLNEICTGHRAALGVECWNKWSQSLNEDNDEIIFTMEDINFSICLNDHKVNFKGFIFPTHAIFEKLQIENNVDFSSCHFKNNASFNETHFRKMANFNEAIFDGATFFERTIFTGNTSFVSSKFKEETHFSHNNFQAEVRFESAVFSGFAYFSYIAFSMAAIFNSRGKHKTTKFKKITDFKNCTFSGLAEFSNCLFYNVITFENCTFAMNCSFQGAKFKHDLNFRYNEIRNTFNFIDTELHKISFITHNTFNKRVSFRPSKAEGPIYFDSSIFANHAEFSQIHFKDSVDFKGSCFKSVLNLNATTFDALPNFSFVDFKVTPDLARTKITNSKPSYNDSVMWRRLKVMANDAQNHEKELEFFRNELEALAFEPEATWTRKKLTSAYGKLSGYGASVSKPVMALFAIMGVFSIIYLFGITDKAWNEGFFTAVFRALFHSFTASIPIVSSLSDTVKDNTEYLFGDNKPLWIGITSMIQTFFSSVLIFLLLLAIRNRFKL